MMKTAKQVTLKGFGDYHVTASGKVISMKSGTPKELSACVGTNGYKNVGLSNKADKKTVTVHRLVALAHVKNSNPKKNNVVNHIDGNKLNNKASNLEWTDHKKNAIHGAALPKNRIARQERRAARKDSYDVLGILKNIHGKIDDNSFNVIFKALVK
jgi:hypothetical protein